MAMMSNEIWDFVWETFANASMTYDLVSSQNVTKGNNEDANLLFENPAKLGILTGFFIACLADFRIATPKLDVCLEAKLKTISITLLNLTIFLLLLPIISPILAILFLYRTMVEYILSWQLNDEFVGLFEGTDCVWALEESTALSVINVLAIFEKNGERTNDDFLADFRDLIEKRLTSSRFDKLNWQRQKKYGYHYWRKVEKIGINERVKWLNEDHEKCAGKCDDIDGKYLKNVLMGIMNKPLPREHSTSWEILIGKNCEKSASKLLEKMEEGLVGIGENFPRPKTTIPVVFRVHHSLGDGVSLLRLLLESIADSKSGKTLENTGKDSQISGEKKFRTPFLRKSSSIIGIVRKDGEIIYNEKNLLSASMPFTTKISLSIFAKNVLGCIEDPSKVTRIVLGRDLRERMAEMIVNSWCNFFDKTLEKVRRRINEFSKIIWIVISVPNCLLQQSLRSMDKSALHGPELEGENFLSCWMEPETSDNLKPNFLAKIRDIKNSTGSRFGDVILAALSENLHNYYSKIGEAAPKSLTVVIPARMSMPSKELTLQNGFSVGLLSLCCSEVNGETVKRINEETRLFDRLEDVKRSSEKLRTDPDYLINFWVMKWLSAILPECLLRPILESHSTMVFSNLPGPPEVTIIGKKLRNVAFWIPHRGKTGLGCSLLTYGGKVHISLMADKALIRNQLLLDEILRKTIEDIEKLYQSISLSCLAAKV